MQPQAGTQQGEVLSAGDRNAVYRIRSRFDLPSNRKELNQIAVLYVAYTTGDDPDKLPHAVESCYTIRSGALDLQDAIQYCMILDYTAYKEILAGRRRPTFQEGRYFTREAATGRWSRYGPMAGFTDPDIMFDYLRAAYAFVQPRADYIRRVSALPPLVLRQLP